MLVALNKAVALLGSTQSLTQLSAVAMRTPFVNVVERWPAKCAIIASLCSTALLCLIMNCQTDSQ
jgi:hypothetical protein